MSPASDRTLVACVPSAVERESQAISQARQAMQRVVDGVNRPVESFTGFELFRGGAREFLEPRWGPRPTAVPYESESGAELVQEALSKTDEKFQQNLNSVRSILDWYSDEQIQANEELIRDRFLSVGAYVGQSIHLYGDNGRPLRSRPEFEEYIEAASGHWVVPAVAIP